MIELISTDAPNGKKTVIMRATMHGHSPITRTMTGDDDMNRNILRREYTQHLLIMMQSFADACSKSTTGRAVTNRARLLEFIAKHTKRDHIQLAEDMQELFTYFFLETMLPMGEGYGHAYGLMIDLKNTSRVFLTDKSSRWVQGPWEQLATPVSEAYTVKLWKDKELKKVA